MAEQISTGEYGGDKGGFMDNGGLLGDTGAAIFDPFQIWHKAATPYAVIAGSPKLSDVQMGTMDSLLKYLTSESNKNQAYGGKLTAGVNPVQLSSMADLLNYKSPTSGLTSDITKSLSDMINSGGRDALENQYQETLAKPLTSTFQNITMPQLMSAFASKGLSYGTERQTATNSASATLMDALARGRTDLEAKVIENKMAGIGKANEVQAQSLAEILGLNTAKTAAGKTIQETEQLGLTNQYNQWLRNQPGSNPAIESIIKLLGIDTMYDQQNLSSSTNSNTGGVVGLISSLFG
jgi:hypothetical protein